MIIYDLIIVGAGITGLSAARYLSKHRPEIKFKILEARDRVGGRTLNQSISLPLSSDKDSCCVPAIVDIGGQWIGPTQKNLHKLIEELEDNNKSLGLIEQTWATRKDKHAGQPGLYEALRVKSLTIEEEEEVIEMNKRLDQMALEISSIQEPFKDCPIAKEWDQISIGEYFEKNVKQKNSLQELLLEILTLTASNPDHVSLLYWLILLRSIPGGYMLLDDGFNGAQHYRLRNGAQNISILMANELKNQYGSDVIQFSQPVTSVTYHDSLLTLTMIPSCQQYITRRLLLAMSPTLLTTIQFTPSLPLDYQKLSVRMFMGQCIKTIFIYKIPFWRQHDRQPKQVEDALRGPVYNIYEIDLHNQMYYALIGLIDGDLAKYWCERSEHELIISIIAQYQYLYNSQEIPIRTIVQYWPNEQFSGGCYSAVFPTNVLSQYGSVLRKPIQFDDSKYPNIWIASTETALEWIGYMAGALESGERTIKEIIKTIQF